jgi:hypothetical protein
VRNCQAFAATLAVAFTLDVAGGTGWSATVGPTVAGAAASSRLDGFLTHTHARRGFSPSGDGSGLASSGIIALVVAIMAVCAIVFLVVTYVRRRRDTG